MTNLISDLEDKFRTLEIQNCFISDLPAEILIHILLELGWKDVLKIRQTCKALHNVSKDKAVWLHLYNESFPGIQKKLDHPFGLYSCKELESYVVRGLKSEIAWKSDRPTKCIQRDIRGEDMDRYWLSDSGRWLLIMSSSGSVVYHDLDNVDVPERTLIPMHGSVDWHLATRMAVDVDNTSSKLAFNLALYLSSKPDESHFEVWRVHLQLDSEGSVPVLVAENLASFKREPGSLVCHMSLLGDELAYSLSASAALPAAVIVVNWNIVPPHAEGDKYHKRTIYPSERRALYIPVHLLPGSRLFVLTRFTMQLFDFGVQNGETYKELWKKYMTNLKEFTLSRPYICPETNSIRMIVGEEQRILGCIIPLHNDRASMSSPFRALCGVALLLDHGRFLEGRRWRASLGYRKGVIHYEWRDGVKSKLLTLNYSWPDDENPQGQLGKEKNKPGRWQGWQQGYNELTGRVVLFTANDGSCISILEFLLSEGS